MIIAYADCAQKYFLYGLLTMGALSAAAPSGDDGTDPFSGITDFPKTTFVRPLGVALLHTACICGAPAARVQELLTQLGNLIVHDTDHLGNTPLMLACGREEIDADVVQALLAAGAIVTNRVLELAEENNASADLFALLQAHKKLS